jgi:malate synthase
VNSVLSDGVQVIGEMGDRYDRVLNTSSLSLLGDLERQFGPRRRGLLERRAERQMAFDRGQLPGFLAETRHVREASWQVAPPVPALINRRVEITGPTDRKMTVNALNSGANIWLADFEDANTPRWQNMVEGQLNLRDALDRMIGFTSPEGKHYDLGKQLATIVVRPRGWHLVEKHVLVDGGPVSAGLFDFAMWSWWSGLWPRRSPSCGPISAATSTRCATSRLGRCSCRWLWMTTSSSS